MPDRANKKTKADESLPGPKSEHGRITVTLTKEMVDYLEADKSISGRTVSENVRRAMLAYMSSNPLAKA